MQVSLYQVIIGSQVGFCYASRSANTQQGILNSDRMACQLAGYRMINVVKAMGDVLGNVGQDIHRAILARSQVRRKYETVSLNPFYPTGPFLAPKLITLIH